MMQNEESVRVLFIYLVLIFKNSQFFKIYDFLKKTIKISEIKIFSKEIERKTRKK